MGRAHIPILSMVALDGSTAAHNSDGTDPSAPTRYKQLAELTGHRSATPFVFRIPQRYPHNAPIVFYSYLTHPCSSVCRNCQAARIALTPGLAFRTLTAPIPRN